MDRGADNALSKDLEFQVIAREFTPEAAAAGEAVYRVLAGLPDVEAFAAAARASGRLSLGGVVTSNEPMKARLLGLALAHTPGQAAYVPLGHSKIDLPEAPAAAELIARLKPLLEDASVRKLSAHAKRDLVVLSRQGVELRGIGFDAIVASYLINPGRRAYSLDDLAFEFLGEKRGSGTQGGSGDDASADQTARTAGGDADLVLRLDRPLPERLEQAGLPPLYTSIGLPLINE